MQNDKNRLLLEMEQALSDANRGIINPEFEELTIDDLAPVLKVVARVRANYLKALFDIATASENNQPSGEEIERLRQLRLDYEELVSASQALQTAIERGYLDVKSSGKAPG